MDRFRRRRTHEDRGAILIHVAIAIIALMALSTFVIDYGVFWVGRGQAQNSADAGALSGAIALAYDDYFDRTPTGPAQESAIAAAEANVVFGSVPSVIADTDVTFPPCPDDGSDGCVRVDVHRTDDRGNPLPVFMGAIIGLVDQDVRATATAKTASGNAAECLKPLAVPAPLPLEGGGELDITEITTEEIGTLIHLRNTGVGQSGGNEPHPYEPGWFQLLDFSNWGASPGQGAAAWRTSMITCPATIGIGAEIPPENGNLGTNVADSINMLYALDEDARWVGGLGGHIEDSCAETLSCMRWVQTGPNHFEQVPDPGRTISPRVLPLAVFDFDAFTADPSVVVVDRIIGFFLDTEMEGPPNFDLYGRLVTDIGVYDGDFGELPPDAGFLKVIQLIR